MPPPVTHDSLTQNIITLREFIERNLEYVTQLEEERWASHANVHALVAAALSKQEQVQDIRNAAQNEWRASMADLTNRFATREWADSQFQIQYTSRSALEHRITELESVNKTNDKLTEDRRAQVTRQQWLIGVVFTVLSLSFAVLSRFVFK